MKLTSILWLLVRTLAAVVAIVAALLLLFQDRLIYFPRRMKSEVARARAEQEGLELLEFTTDSGIQLAYFCPPPEGELERLWLVFGGNGQIALDWVDFCRRHAQPGRGYLLVEYPGYGANEGSPAPDRIAAVARAANAAFVGRYGAPPRTAALGLSMGGASALAAAADLGIERIVVAACFTDMLTMAKRTVGWPLNHLLRHRFDNVASLARLESTGARVTLLHGDQDELIPVEQGRELAERFATIVEYEELTGADHNDVLWFDPELVARALARD